MVKFLWCFEIAFLYNENINILYNYDINFLRCHKMSINFGT